MTTPELMEVHNDDDVVDIINCVALYYEKLRRQQGPRRGRGWVGFSPPTFVQEEK